MNVRRWMDTRKILFLNGLLFMVLCSSASVKLQFYTDVYAWYPDGKIEKVSPGDGIYFQPCIHPEGTHVVYYGNSSGTPRVWVTDLKSGETVALTSEEAHARHPVILPLGVISTFL
jgi:Tol biopolymer transport system component